MKYKPRRDLPQFVRRFKTFSPSQLREIILSERNIARTPQSITVWFKAHPDIYEELRHEVIVEELSKEEVSEKIFSNGVFEELSSVKNWIKDLTIRKAKNNSIKKIVGDLKRVCKGQNNGEKIKGWVLKHPDRLTLEDAKEYIYQLEIRGRRTRNYRTSLRSFLTSKGILVKNTDISGGSEMAGLHADLYAPKKKLYKIFDWLKTINKEAYLASKFAYKTATRLTATLDADASRINFEEHTITVFDKASRGQDKKMWIKLIPEGLWEELPKQGKLFNIKARELNKLLRRAYRKIIPELEPRIKNPFHFWRHQFAQHMLRSSNWNYGLVASLGGWSLEALRRYYGMPPQAVIKQFGLKHLPKI